ncbi:MAG TPA: tetratricopeptide repeat protein [Pyrinomonadaceae bacterium]|jgi:tetratricopeptide (TPR) repeat protein
MRDKEVISNSSAAGACRALGCVASLTLALVLCAGSVCAQKESTKTRARRVAASDSSVKKDDAEAIASTDATAPASAAKAAGEASMEEEPPALDEEADKGDRLSTLRAQIKHAKTEGQRARLQRTLVDYLVALNQKGEAIEQLQLMLREERFDPVGFYNIGNALARLGDTDTAIEAYRKAIEQRQGHYARALNNLGVVLMRQGRWEEAQEALTSALRQEAFRYAEASYNLGRLHSLRGEADLAIREWNRALSLQPDHADAALALARALAEDGNPQRAIAIIDAFNKRHGTNQELSEARREILYGAEADDAEAAVEMKTAATANSRTASSDAPIMVNTKATRSTSTPKANASERSERSAASSSLRSLTVDRETYELLERARAAREAGDKEEAVNFYNRALMRRGGFLPPANLEISFVLAGLGRHEEAIASLQKLVAREGARYPIAYYHLGRRYEALGQLSAAADAYGRAAFAYGEREPQFLLDVSRVREKEGNLQAALGALEEYARISERRGRTPEWIAGRIAELRQKQTRTTAQPQATAPKP